MTQPTSKGTIWDWTVRLVKWVAKDAARRTFYVAEVLVFLYALGAAYL